MLLSLSFASARSRASYSGSHAYLSLKILRYVVQVSDSFTIVLGTSGRLLLGWIGCQPVEAAPYDVTIGQASYVFFSYFASLFSECQLEPRLRPSSVPRGRVKLLAAFGWIIISVTSSVGLFHLASSEAGLSSLLIEPGTTNP